MRRGNKLIKCIFVLVVFSAFIMFRDVKAYSEYINKITMDVELQDNGDAHIQEIWNTELYSGTEMYKPYANMGDMKIQNLRVSDEKGTLYETKDYWNTSASFSFKANKCGLNRTSDGVEICWGLTEYGRKEYTIDYDVTNFVNQYTDAQGVYFEFLHDSMDPEAQQVYVTIHPSEDATFTFNEENSKIWSFGYPNGIIEFKDGVISMDSCGEVDSNEYMVGLIKFEEPLFNTTHEVDQTWDEVYESAMEGATDVWEDEPWYVQALIMIIVFILFVIMALASLILNPITIIVLILVLATKGSGNNGDPTGERLDFKSIGGRKLTDLKEQPYTREIPQDLSFIKAYYLLYIFDYPGRSVEGIEEGYMGAVLLKWIRNKEITLVPTKSGIFSFKNNDYAIDLSNLGEQSDSIENTLRDILLKAAGNDRLLEAKEFEKWNRAHYSQLYNMYSQIKVAAKNKYKDEGLLVLNEGKGKKLHTVKPELKEKANELMGLKHFLLDFSLIKEREAIEVMLWDEYLMYANILGIADKVEEQFSDLYPDFKDIREVTKTIRSMSHSSVVIVNREHNAAISRSYSSSSSSYSHTSYGGGGHSYSGGGHSSGGHSSGGGRR